jgi:hypothetical protein
MAVGTFHLPGGTKVRSSSARRFVVVVRPTRAEYKPYIEYRTDDVHRAIARARKVGLAAVVVDTVGHKVFARSSWAEQPKWVDA